MLFLVQLEEVKKKEQEFGSRAALQSLIWLFVCCSICKRAGHRAHYPNQWSFKLQSLLFQILPKNPQHTPRAGAGCRTVPAVLFLCQRCIWIWIMECTAGGEEGVGLPNYVACYNDHPYPISSLLSSRRNLMRTEHECNVNPLTLLLLLFSIGKTYKDINDCMIRFNVYCTVHCMSVLPTFALLLALSIWEKG